MGFIPLSGHVGNIRIRNYVVYTDSLPSLVNIIINIVTLELNIRGIKRNK